MFRNYEQCCVIIIQVHVDDMLNITKDYNDEQVLAYYIAARWMCAFAGGRESGKYKLGAGCKPTAADEVYVVCVRTLLEAN
jgi:hypothetical protein